ncbi:collagen alpha-1(XXV) chain [Folsomia candida]|uniref:Collagen alpha-1(XXI) chain n=1 Tax=Folsomia candida TaxID=158441 RepID=A0A226DZ54_FOLCA|nr:collagen alpha-1(XXV) chain [Folsomia candida]OXA50563.1 Collagen alpha-1(XXI) chain [Folsomia candida]
MSKLLQLIVMFNIALILSDKCSSAFGSQNFQPFKLDSTLRIISSAPTPSGLRFGCVTEKNQDYDEILELFAQHDESGQREVARLDFSSPTLLRTSSLDDISGLYEWPEECISGLISSPSPEIPHHPGTKDELDQSLNNGDDESLASLFFGGCNCPPGPDGRDGPAGLMGLIGVTGNPGKDGSNGLPGNRGRIGRKGEPGYRGDKGDRGDVGDMGSPGKDGLDGLPGRNGRSVTYVSGGRGGGNGTLHTNSNDNSTSSSSEQNRLRTRTNGKVSQIPIVVTIKQNDKK